MRDKKVKKELIVRPTDMGKKRSPYEYTGVVAN